MAMLRSYTTEKTDKESEESSDEGEAKQQQQDADSIGRNTSHKLDMSAILHTMDQDTTKPTEKTETVDSAKSSEEGKEAKKQEEEEKKKKRPADLLNRPPRVAMLVAGCGFLDGVDIHEVFSTTVHLDGMGVVVEHTTPYGTMENIYDHSTRDLDKREYRMFEKEGARIIRRKMVNVRTINPSDFDALIIPGGLAWFRNTSNLEMVHDEMLEFESNKDVNRLVLDFHAQKKPIFTISTGIGAVGIALGKSFGGPGLQSYTIGTETVYAEYLEKAGNTGAQEIDPSSSICDKANNVWSTPGMAGYVAPQFEVVFTNLGKYCKTMFDVMAESIGRREADVEEDKEAESGSGSEQQTQ